MLLAAAFAPSASAGGAAITARGSVEQVDVTGATPGASYSLVNSKRQGHRHPQGRTRSGGIVFRHVDPGSGYRVREGGQAARHDLAALQGPQPALGAAQHQHLQPDASRGRLRLPDDPRRDEAGDQRAASGRQDSRDGPFPTLLEYSGYGYANPGRRRELDPGAASRSSASPWSTSTCAAPAARAAPSTTSSRSRASTATTRSRRSPASPGSSTTRLRMTGVSYGGISQLFVGATRPPSLAAITPLSVIDNTQTTLYPGGILNSGFALSWAKDRVHDALPASPTGGQSWAYQRIQNGDTVCAANQDLHPGGRRSAGQDQAQPLLPAQGRRPALAGHLRPQDQGPRLPRLPVDRRADRRPLPRPRR